MANPRPDGSSPISQRFVAVDVLRGLAIAGMILVNSPGDWDHLYAPIAHSDWNGCTLADLVFPAFLFIAGAAIPLAFARRPPAAPWRALPRIARRALLLFAIGLFINGFPSYYDPATLRIPGVLQRIAVCYLVGACLALTTKPRTQAALAGAILVGYWALLALVPAPGGIAGDLSSKEGNLVAWFDQQVLWGHLIHNSWDPEGVLSTLPAIATTLTGMLAGHWILSARGARAQARGLALAGALGVVAGLVWSTSFPMNKSLWTSSYVLFCSGISLLLLAACTALVERTGARGPAFPLVVLGANPILAYVGSLLVDMQLDRSSLELADGTWTTPKYWIWQHLFTPWAGPTNGSLLYAVAYVLAWLGVAALLYRRRVFVKV